MDVMTFEKSVHAALWGIESWEISAHTSDPGEIADGEQRGRRHVDRAEGRVGGRRLGGH